ncbi:MAG: hypothetical protein JNM94_06015 [Phycisphaerae bacterium]|nr:hypothetical protein [Phycisphaerae bacterium]
MRVPSGLRFAAVVVGTSFVAHLASAQGDGSSPVVSREGERRPGLAEVGEPPVDRTETLTRQLGLAPTDRMLRLRTLDASEVEAADIRARSCDACGEREARGKGGRRRIGLARPVAETLGRAARPETDFDVRRLDDGRFLVRVVVTSPGASGLRLRFADVDLADGAMVVSAPYGNGEIVRPAQYQSGVDEIGELWTASVPGDTIQVEVVASALPSLELVDVIHRDAAPPATTMSSQPDAPATPNGSGASTPMSDGGVAGGPLTCHLDATCFVNAATQIAYDATGQMNFVENGSEFVCSGTMLADFDGETFVPWFLTAYHCFSTQASASSLEVVWFWQTATCDGALPDYNTLPRTVGSKLVATNPTDGGNDMTFVRLTGALPPNAAFCGWTTALPGLAKSFHHPAGSFKRYATWDDVSVCIPCGVCADSSDYQFYNSVLGLTEPGSSGSGIFSYDGKLFGQLFGTCTDVIGNPPITCSTIDDYWHYFGEFEETYPLIDVPLTVGGTFWANAAYPQGLPETGAQATPFNTFAEAYNASFDGAQIKLVPGAYSGTITVTKELLIKSVGGSATIGN